MKVPSNYSEDMRSTGGTRTELLNNVLDSSISLDKWSVFLRETLQNSNDQRLPESPSITFGLHYEMLSADGFAILKEMIQLDGPHKSDEEIRISPNASELPILIVSDSGTRGLTGGTDARKEDDSNFCNFFYFSGQLESRTTGGGSYGIGRNVLFSASRIRTIVVYSQIIQNGQPEQRFMAMAASKGLKHNGFNYTGRHWWGQVGAADFDGVQPILGEEALQLARAFGLNKHLDKGTGTVIGVIDPDMDEPNAQMESLATTLLINAWPHLVGTKSEPPTLTAAISYLGETFEIPDPRSQDSPIAPFVSAYLEDNSEGKIFSEELKFNGSLEHLSKWVTGTDKTLGKLTWLKSLAPAGEVEHVEKGLTPGSTVALMRSAKLIVEYMSVSAPEDGSRVFGVFKVGTNFEKAFRKAETPTHDKWLRGRLDLPVGARNPVGQAEDGITKIFDSAKSSKAKGGEEIDTPVDLANRLGKLITGLGVTGGSITPPTTGGGGGGGGRSSSLKIRTSARPRLISKSNGTCVGEFFFKTSGKITPGTATKYSPILKVWLGDSFEKEAPAGSIAPAVKKVLYGESTSGRWLEFKNSEITATDLEGINELKVVVQYPSDMLVSCEFESIAS